MADENKQVTMTFGGHDENNDNTVMFESPYKIVATLENVSLLYTFDVSKYETGSNIVIFIKNVNNTTSASIGEIPYRGSYYMYDWEKSGWQQIALGNHSHSNMAILDQLGEVNTDTLEVGDKKVLTIEKIDTDESPATTDYKLAFEDKKELPVVPEDAKGKHLYLTTDASGNFQWENTFVPAQTFKLIKVVVSASNRITNKKLLLANSVLTAQNIYYNKDLNDEIVVFDNGSLVSNTITTVTADGLEIDINDTEDAHTFDLNETITILIIRNGIAGLLDSIKSQYMTKSDAIELLTNGTINLNQYITKQDLELYASKLNHTHSQYIRKNDYDIFDYRYADYQHTHAEYTTRAQVLSIIADAADAEGNIDTNQIVETIVRDLETQITELNNSYYNKNQIDSLLSSTKRDVSSSDNIEVTFDGRNLSDYLIYLETKSSNIESVDADIIQLESDKINIGENNTLGGYTNGDTIKKGTTLTQFVHKLITKEVPVVLAEPTFDVTYKTTNLSAGSKATMYITPSYTQNNGGQLLSLFIKIYKKDNVETTDEPLYNIVAENNAEFSMPIVLDAYNEFNKCYHIIVEAEYAEGTTYLSNVGKSYKISAGKFTKEFYIYNERQCIFGTFQRNITDDIPFTSDDAWDATYSTLNNSIFEYKLKEEDFTNGIKLSFIPETKGKVIIFALPKEKELEITKIFFENQRYDITDDFETMDLVIPDVQKNTINYINNNYTVYYYNLNQAIQSEISFTIYISLKGE